MNMRVISKVLAHGICKLVSMSILGMFYKMAWVLKLYSLKLI